MRASPAQRRIGPQAVRRLRDGGGLGRRASSSSRERRRRPRREVRAAAVKRAPAAAREPCDGWQRKIGEVEED
jgi:hypothetical protein